MRRGALFAMGCLTLACVLVACTSENSVTFGSTETSLIAHEITSVPTGTDPAVGAQVEISPDSVRPGEAFVASFEPQSTLRTEAAVLITVDDPSEATPVYWLTNLEVQGGPRAVPYGADPQITDVAIGGPETVLVAPEDVSPGAYLVCFTAFPESGPGEQGWVCDRLEVGE